MKQATLSIFSVLISCIILHAQTEEYNSPNSHTKVFFIEQNQGLIINLPEKLNTTTQIKHIPTYNMHIGFYCSYRYDNIKIGLGFARHGYSVGAYMGDSDIKQAHESVGNFVDAYWYYRIPFRIGYIFETPNKKFSIEPFIGSSMLLTRSEGVGFSSTGRGWTIYDSPYDSIYSEYKIKMVRPTKFIFTKNAGLKLSYNFNRINICFTAEYFNSRENWTIIEVEYYRESLLHGSFYQKERIYSKAKTLNFGLSIEFKFQ